MRRLNPSSYNLFLLVIALVVAFGFYLVWRLRRDVEEESGAVSDEELLKSFEQAYYEGEMEEAEFRSVTEKLKARMATASSPTPNVPEPPRQVEGEARPPSASPG